MVSLDRRFAGGSSSVRDGFGNDYDSGCIDHFGCPDTNCSFASTQNTADLVTSLDRTYSGCESN